MKRFLFVAIAFFFGCSSSSEITVQPGFWRMKDRTIGVATLHVPIARAYQLGSQGFLEMAINMAMTSSLEKHLTTLSSDSLIYTVDRFADTLTAYGFKVRRIETPINLDALPRLHTADGVPTEQIDFRPLKTSQGVDLLIILAIKQWGTARKYYGFLPLDDPRPACIAQGLLVELSSNTIAWYQEMLWIDSGNRIRGLWDVPPDYPYLTVGVQHSVPQAMELLQTSFFSNAPNGSRLQN